MIYFFLGLSKYLFITKWLHKMSFTPIDQQLGFFFKSSWLCVLRIVTSYHIPLIFSIVIKHVISALSSKYVRSLLPSEQFQNSWACGIKLQGYKQLLLRPIRVPGIQMVCEVRKGRLPMLLFQSILSPIMEYIKSYY